jgi:hypothetical protein
MKILSLSAVAAVLSISVFACSGGSDSSTSGWQFGNSADEDAYCKAYGIAGASSPMTGTCVLGDTANREAECRKDVSCQRKFFVPSVLGSGVEACLTKAATCARNVSGPQDCWADAVDSFPDNAIYTACEAKDTRCRAAETYMDTECFYLKGIKPELVAARMPCFSATAACGGEEACVFAGLSCTF